jgi:Alginate export
MLLRKILTGLIVLSPSLLQAGDGKSPTAPPAPPAEVNPLSFMDGALTLDFHARARVEARENNFDFNDGVDSLTDDAWLLQRTRLGLLVKPAPWLRIYAQGQDTRELGADRPNIIGQLGAEGDDSFDLRQAYIGLGDLKSGPSLTVGRQVLSYGDERLIGGADWLNQGRVFDAVKFRYTASDWSLDAFTSSVVAPIDQEFNQSDWINSDSTREQLFSGLYFTSTGLLPTNTVDLYALQLHESYDVGDTDFVTLGGRLKGDPTKHGGFDYETEMAFQVGEVKGKDLQAFAGHWGLGYAWTTQAWKPRLFAEYNFATGDSDPTDGEVGTFRNLFPTNHKFYGFMDAFSWQNVHNPALSFSVQPSKTLTLRTDFHAFLLADTADAWYRANGVTPVRTPNSTADAFAGTELDFTATWKPTKNFTIQAGYSHFFAGDSLKATGAHDDADFGYLSVGIDF